ncbi:hypothetical protein DBT40_07350 [Aerococcus tenax]|nr:hypothetical protein DBT40_07350 [Aerococcus urinae]RAW04319.1 hypothetical protein DBT41_07455 [Aerococcus urinae]
MTDNKSPCNRKLNVMKAVYSRILKVVPELEDLFKKRMQILQMVLRFQPIGRQILAKKLDMTERPLRRETNILKKEGLLDSTRNGMVITAKGEEALAFAREMLHEDSSLFAKEQRLEKQLGIDEVHIIESNLDEENSTLAQIGVFLSNYLANTLPEGYITVAVSGGSTILEVAKSLNRKVLTKNRHFTIVPARGGMGDSVAIQANTISDQLAHRLNGTTNSLYVPDVLTEETRDLLVKEPSIQATLNILKRTDALLFSVGDARIMAQRRGFSSELIDKILAKGAIGEAFGCFYTNEGEIVYQMPRIGLQLDQIKDIQYPILIAGGRAKAKAIQAFAKLAPFNFVLVTDLGVSNQVLNEETH